MQRFIKELNILLLNTIIIVHKQFKRLLLILKLNFNIKFSVLINLHIL